MNFHHPTPTSSSLCPLRLTSLGWAWHGVQTGQVITRGSGEPSPSSHPGHLSLVQRGRCQGFCSGQGQSEAQLGVKSLLTPHLKSCLVSAVVATEPESSTCRNPKGQCTDGNPKAQTREVPGPRSQSPATWDCPCSPSLPSASLISAPAVLLPSAGIRGSIGQRKNVWHSLARNLNDF